METAKVFASCGTEILVDRQDVPAVSAYKWHIDRHANGKCYAATNVRKSNGKLSTLRMHRVITGAARGVAVDHEDNNGLNNRRTNLRVCKNRFNVRNARIRTEATKTSRFKGVTWMKRRCTWNAKIMVDFVSMHLGAFDSEEWAALAYDAAARLHFGEFARVNFSERNPTPSEIVEKRRR